MNIRFSAVFFVLAPFALASACATSTQVAGLADAGDAGVLEAAADQGLPDVAPIQEDAAVDVAPDTKKDAAVGECSDKAKQVDCTNCCTEKYLDGAGAYLLAVNDCMCVESRCQKACAETFCAPDLKEPDALCNDCMTDKSGECSAPITSDCNANADCVAFNVCMLQSKCAKKP